MLRRAEAVVMASMAVVVDFTAAASAGSMGADFTAAGFMLAGSTMASGVSAVDSAAGLRLPDYDYDYYPDYGNYYGQPYYNYGRTNAAQTWYYCSNRAGYYPYVTQCNTGWQAVPAS